MPEEIALTGAETEASAYIADGIEPEADETTEEDPGGQEEESEEQGEASNEDAPEGDDQIGLPIADLAELFPEDAEALAGLSEAARTQIGQDIAYKNMANELWSKITDPENGKQAFAEFAKQLGYGDLISGASQTGNAPSNAAGTSAEPDYSQWYEKGYASETEYKLDVRLNRLESENKQLKEAQLRDQREREASEKLDRAHEAIAKAVADANHGFRPSKAQVKEAVKAFPNMPVAEAVEAKFHKAIMQHRDKQTGRPEPQRGPEIARGGGSRGVNVKLGAGPSDPSIYKS